MSNEGCTTGTNAGVGPEVTGELAAWIGRCRLSWVVTSWEYVVDWYRRQIPQQTETQVFFHPICLLVDRSGGCALSSESFGKRNFYY
jgi:hypothetical protein